MRQINPINKSSGLERELITRIAVRIEGAIVALHPRSVLPPELVRITIDDFRGLEWFTLSIGLIPPMRAGHDRTQSSRRRKCTLRDVWSYGGDGIGQWVFGQEHFQEDNESLRGVISEWDASEMCEIDQKYRLWNITLTSALSAKPMTPLQDLPWIIENGFNDFAPKLCAIALNPNGEAQEYLKEVWGVE